MAQRVKTNLCSFTKLKFFLRDKSRKITELRNEILDMKKTELTLKTKTYEDYSPERGQQEMELENYIIGRMIENSLANEDGEGEEEG